MMAKETQTWPITGCSNGFGEIFAHNLSAAGDSMIATGWDAQTTLAHLEDTGTTLLHLDIAAPAAHIEGQYRRSLGIVS